MAPVHALDPYYLGLAILVTTGYQLLGFAIAWTFQFDKITDFTGGSNFFLLALLTLLIGNTFYVRNVVASVLVMVWATRLAGFLLFRVLKMGSDARFDEIRSHFFKFFAFWIGQIVWVWIVSLPVIILNSPAVSDPARGGVNPAFGTSKDIAGIVIWALGWIVETVADAQKFHYKSTKPPRNQPNTYGIWAWSRHPPYFGEIMCWWGIWILTISPSTNGALAAPQKPHSMVPSLLLFGSGVPTAEKPSARRFYLMTHGPRAPDEDVSAWTAYKAYLRSTSLLVPLPPALYRRLPEVVKRTVLLDWPIYRFDEKTDGPRAIEEERRKLGEGLS